MATYDCPPTLNDTQVLEFCKLGFLMLEGVVPEEINQRTLAYVEAHPEAEPTAILKEAWFHSNVIVNTAVAGAVRSLLVGSSRVDLQACKLEYSIVSPK